MVRWPQVLHYARDLEFLARLKRQLSRARGRTIYKHVVVIDLSGLGMAHCPRPPRAVKRP